MLYSFGCFLLPHLPLDRDDALVGIRDEVALQYYRLDRVHTGAIGVAEGEPQYVKLPTETGTRKAQDDQAPLSEIIETLNERFGTRFTEEDRLFFDQIKERACNSDAVVRTALANPIDRFEMGVRGLIEDLMTAVGKALGLRVRMHRRPAHQEIHARGFEDLGLSHLWVLYPGDREYPLTDAVTALPLKNIHDVELWPGS